MINTLFNLFSNFGLSALVETEWVRLNVPCVLRTFWLLRVAEHAGTLVFNVWSYPDDSVQQTDMPFLVSTMKSLLISGCETLTAVLGMTSIISYVCHYIGCFFQWVSLTVIVYLINHFYNKRVHNIILYFLLKAFLSHV